MQLFLRGLGPQPQLDAWEETPYATGVLLGPGTLDHRDSYEREVAQESPGPPEDEGPHRRIEAAIRRYEIFPKAMVSGVLRQTPVTTGDTVGILFHAPLGLELFFAARVTESFDMQVDAGGERWWRSGFTYRTLRGHPEIGEETFSVEKNLTTGAVRVSLRSWSRPGTWLARTFSKVVRRLQVRASHAALEHLAQLAAAATSTAPA